MNNPGAGGEKGNGSGPPTNMRARKKRVELLRERVAKGTYRVHSRKVAEKIIEDALRAIRSRDVTG